VKLPNLLFVLPERR